MNIKNKIITKELLYAIMLLFMTVWACGAWAQNETSQEKLLYSTDFTDWDDIDRKVAVNKEVKLKTQFSDEDLIFTLNGVGADPKGTKFSSYTGYMITAKYTGEYKKAQPSAVTSPLKSITKIVLTQAATGGKRGIKVSVKGDNDTEWVALHNKTIENSKGETLTIDVNRTNCQIQFENFTLSQNAYIVDLKIYGNYDGEEKKVRTLDFPPQDGIVGKYPSKIKCDNDGYAVMPEGNGFSLPGYTFVAWTDGTNDYTPGKTYQFTKDVTRIKPKMKENTYHLYDANKEMEIVWPFDHTEAPTLNVFQENAQKDLSYTRPVDIYIDDNTTETQDVALNINVKKGKIDNTDNRINALPGKGAVVRNGTAFTLPAIYGMKVSIKASEKVDSDNGNLQTIFGTNDNNVQIKLKDTANKDSLTLKDAELSADRKTMTFTYKGDEPTITLTTFGNKGSKYDHWHFESITATYPLLPNVVCNNTITNADPKNFPNEKAINAGDYKVELKDPTATSHANIGTRFKVDDVVIITPTAKYGYDFKEIVVDGTTYTTIPYEYKVKDGINNIEVKYTRKEMHKITIKPSDPNLGTVSLSPRYDNFYNEKYNDKGEVTQIECWYTEGTQVEATGEAITDYMIDYWKEENGTQHNGISYEFTVGTSNQTTLTAHFALGHPGNVNFVIPEGLLVNGEGQKKDFKNAISVTPNSINNVRSFTIPTNYTLFKSIDNEGNAVEQYYTLKYWTQENDKTQIYKLGNTYSFSKEGETINLVPVFEMNNATQENRINNPVIRYDFARKVKEYDDHTAKETRKVCAQTVNIGKEQQVFWTTKVWVEVREGGQDKPHWRDVALWCDTGKKGYIRNGQFDNWCAFGPGTTLWFPSGTGTKISLMSYSKITTTTIDDSVPTLDRERTNSERKKAGLPSLEEEENGAKSYMYVYTHTTKNPSLRPAIKIGDDYSYYQWLELSTLAANWVNLHTETNDELRGIINKKDIKPVTTDEGHEYRELEDGGVAFHKGERVKMTFNRKKGYELDKILDPDKLDKNGEPVAVLKMNDDGTVNMVGFDDVSTTTPVAQNPDGSWGTASSSVFVLRKAEKDQPGKECYLSSDNIRTQYELEFDITTHRRLQICFKEMKNTYYITYNAGNQAEGTSPEATWVEKGDRFTIPTNKTLYYEGNTLDHWKDENNNIFTIGKEYTAEGKDRRLFPVFNANAFNFYDLAAEATATWYLNKEDGAPTINYEKTKGILVTQLKNSKGESIDIKVELDATNGGKFNNTDSTRTGRIQINSNSVIEFPSTPNCVVTWVASSDFEKIKIADNIVNTDATNKRQVEAECSGKSAYEKIEFIDGIYSRHFSITYKPQNTTTKPTIESLTCGGTTYNAAEIKDQIAKNKHVTFHVSPWELNEQIPDVSGTATNGGKVVATKATIETKECVATVHTASDVITETYPIVFEFNTPEEGNDPKVEKININGVDYTQTSNEIFDAPQNGAIKIKFSRTMNDATITSTENNVTCTAKSDNELVFKYWDAPQGGTVTFNITPKSKTFTDIYTKTCQEPITIKLHIMDDDEYYHHHKFDFVVGKDGNIDEAIKAANGEAEGKPYNNNKTNGHRYYIFVPDGEYKLTGNGTINFVGEGPVDETGTKRPDMNGKNNGQTHIRKPNISIIGQSKDNTIIRNHPIVEGISYTATLYVEKNNTDFYAEDLTLENEFDYWGTMAGQSSSSGAGRADVFYDCGNRSIMKNVALKSYQDTYYSNNASPDYRGYFENCDFYGVVDYICGNGNIWFEKCNLILRDRKGNNIAAPRTEVDQEWGYVFNECSIKPESDNMIRFTDKDWTLARAWNNSPACTYLNTKMYTQPQSYGWGRGMDSNLMLRFHEYKSIDGADNMLSLVTRSLAACVPAAGSDDVILSEEQASGYTLRNVVGGTDGFEPNELCMQIDAASGAKADYDENHEVWNDDIVLDDDILQWNKHTTALCYVVFKLNEATNKWEYIDNTTDAIINLADYGSGYYSVRAANQRGGLGAATKAIRYILQDPYKLEIKKVGDYKEEGVDYGWTTICLPFNAKVPEEVNVYAATAHGKQTESDKVEDFIMTLTPVEIIDSLKGYIVYGAVGDHYFKSTSRTCDKSTILTGNPTDAAISSTNINCYVLAYKTWGLGLYKYTGATLAAYHAWLPEDMVSKSNQEDLALGKRGICFVISDPTTGMSHPIYTIETKDDAIYNISGQRVKSPIQPGLYIFGRTKAMVK
ncbi:MAG: pectinesterase family protein [Prevotella sp.]|nr:pectinesterase family protein [Prevotella sp.]